jgi:hypothetical protein
MSIPINYTVSKQRDTLKQQKTRKISVYGKLTKVCVLSIIGSWDSSVSTVSGYGVNDQAIKVQSVAEARDSSSSLCVQTGLGAHPASCTMRTQGPFPGGKTWPGHDTDHSSLFSDEVMNE